jgi:N-acetylmuramoyl-L-alanine amidase
MSYSVRNNPANGNNFTVGRQGSRINKIVIHHAATTDFDGIARTFQAAGRGASAHYGVGRNNNVDKYVDESNTAWHCGNWQGNISSVGIENVNDSGAPEWRIGDSTFNTLVELVRDIANRNGLLPLKVGVNLFGHRDFMATACPGQLYGRLQELADKVNGGQSSGGGSPASGKKSNEEIAREVLAGSWGNNPERRDRLVAAGYDYNAIQAIVNGQVGNPTAPRKSADVIANEVLAGAWGNGPDRKARLEAAGYNYNEVQAIVNRKVGAGNPQAPVPSRPSEEAIADQVIAGAWGNGPDRQARLAQAGYNYTSIQNIVNRKLGIGASAPARKSDDQIANEVLAGSWGNGPDRVNRLNGAGYNAGVIQSIVNRKLGL